MAVGIAIGVVFFVKNKMKLKRLFSVKQDLNNLKSLISSKNNF
jgi:hypothetical protein